MESLELEFDVQRLRKIKEEEVEEIETEQSGIGNVGFGQVKSLDRLDEQNCRMLLYKYHCRLASNLLGMMAFGSWSCGIVR